VTNLSEKPMGDSLPDLRRKVRILEPGTPEYDRHVAAGKFFKKLFLCVMVAAIVIGIYMITSLTRVILDMFF